MPTHLAYPYGRGVQGGTFFPNGQKSWDMPTHLAYPYGREVGGWWVGGMDGRMVGRRVGRWAGGPKPKNRFP